MRQVLAGRQFVAVGVGFGPGADFIKLRNFTSNYVVYWSQLTATSQCSLQPVS